MAHQQPVEEALSVVPANATTCDHLRTIFGSTGDASWCQCQYFKVSAREWRSMPVGQRSERLRAQTACGRPTALSTSGLVAYLGSEPVGWCAVEPRTAYPRLRRARVPWSGRAEDMDDDGVWAATCFVTRTGFRRRGIARGLARAAVDVARRHGARAVEGYPVVPPGASVSPDELYVGTRDMFAAAGFVEVSRPTERRAVMRLEL